MSKILKGLNESRSDWDNNMPGYRGDYGGADNWDSGKKAFRRQEADQEWKREQEYTRQREQQQAELAQYNETGKFWLKLKDTQQHLPAGPFVGKQSANQAAIELLKQQPELKGNLVITAYGPDEQINELSNATLASYKKKAGEYASAADKAAEISHKGGEHEVGKRWTDRADKRFSGIVKATKKQFDNDAKGVNESDLEEGAMDSIKSGIKSVSNRFSKKPASTASIMPNTADANTAKQAVDKAVAVVKTVDDSELPKVVSYGKQQFDSLSAPTPASDANTIAAPVATRASIPQTTTPSAPVTNTTYAQIKQLISKMDKKGKQRLLATINKSLNVTEGIPDVDHMNGPRGINLPVADTRDILQKPFEFYGNYKEWYSDVNRVNSELLDDNAEYTSMAGGKIISINGKDFAFWSNRNGNGSIDIRIAKKHSGQDVAEGSKTPTDWMGVPTKLAKNDKKPIKRPSGYDEYIKQGAKQGFQDDPTNPLRKKVKEQGVAETELDEAKVKRTVEDIFHKGKKVGSITTTTTKGGITFYTAQVGNSFVAGPDTREEALKHLKRLYRDSQKEQGVAEGSYDYVKRGKELDAATKRVQSNLDRRIRGKELDAATKSRIRGKELDAATKRVQSNLDRRIKKLDQGVAEGSSTTWEVSFDYGPHQSETVKVKARSAQEAVDKVETAAEKKGRSIMVNWARPAEQDIEEEKQRLDPSCWKGYKKQGTKMKGDTRVNNCVPVSESSSSILEGLQQVDEINWKHAAAAGAMALGALGGAGQAQAQFNPAGLSTVYLQQVAAGEHQRPMVSVDAAKAELQARADGKQQKVSSQSDTSSKPFTPVDYQTKEPLKKGADGKWYNSNGEERDGLHGGPMSSQGTAMFRSLKPRQ